MALEAIGVARPDSIASVAPTRVEALAHRAARGDVDAFDELVSLHAGKVVNLAFRLLGDATDADDVAQEAFVKAYRSLPRLRDRSQFTAWMLKITTNACRDYLRRRGRRDEVGLDEAINHAGGDATAHVVEQQETQQRIRYLMNTLPQKHQIVLYLRDIEGLSYDEIATTLGCTVSSVKNRLHRAREAFRIRAMPYVDEVLPWE